MSLRQTFLLLVVPLFVLLAGINGALLYGLERDEAVRGLEGQAIAAAVTTAAFAEGRDDLAAALADPVRDGALREAARRIPGLDGLYLVGPEGAAVRIAGSGPRLDPGRFARPARAMTLPVQRTAAGRQVVTGLAPAGAGRFVIAQIDAAPLLAEVAGLKRLIAGLVAVVGLVGFAIAWLVAGRIRGELARNEAVIAAIRGGAAAVEPPELSIRETRDLAHAVRLMQVSVARREARGRHELARLDRRRDEAAAVAAHRAEALPPLAEADFAIRMVGAADPGAFYAVWRGPERAALILGECAGASPAEALALALAARRVLEAEGPAALETVGRAFGLTRSAVAQWNVGVSGDLRALALLDADQAGRAAAFARRAQGLAPADLLDDLVVLLEPRGVLAAVRASGDGGEG
jgi:hypothetical protein